MTWLAFDIGGANLKVADGVGYAASVPFPLWQKPEQLEAKIRWMISERPQTKQIAVTMTGELADCFATRTAGVLFILDAVKQAAETFSIAEIYVYLIDGELVPLSVAYENPLAAAAANWLAAASFAAESLKHRSALLVDLGSTTCDIVPLVDQLPKPTARTDTERLIAGELVYTGVQRTPLCAVAESVPFRSQRCPLAAEWFATTWDVYLQLDKLPEVPSSLNTADVRPATKENAKNRLARSLCVEAEEFTESEATKVAQYLEQTQCSKIAVAMINVIRRMEEPATAIVTSGVGEFLLPQVIAQLGYEVEIISLNELLSPTVSVCAPAHALATIARSSFTDDS